MAKQKQRGIEGKERRMIKPTLNYEIDWVDSFCTFALLRFHS